MMFSRLRIVLAAQLLFFVAWGGWLLASRNSASPAFYLETTPVDPRDLISGTYVALTYGISRPQAGLCPAMLNSGRDFFVKLESRGRTAATAEGAVPVYEAAACAGYPPPDEQGWVHADPQPGFPGPAARYGIEKFFLNENDPRKDARSGSVVARVRIGRDHRLQLLDLVRKI
ncbi:MAG: GDYXXLXY domain-containing protein [Elusimicrobia bacterium]|nr:GDYXXLXY domain-containing protein [Elusimicrobiota bacterium]